LGGSGKCLNSPRQHRLQRPSRPSFPPNSSIFVFPPSWVCSRWKHRSAWDGQFLAGVSLVRRLVEVCLPGWLGGGRVGMGWFWLASQTIMLMLVCVNERGCCHKTSGEWPPAWGLWSQTSFGHSTARHHQVLVYYTTSKRVIMSVMPHHVLIISIKQCGQKCLWTRTLW